MLPPASLNIVFVPPEFQPAAGTFRMRDATRKAGGAVAAADAIEAHLAA